MALDGTCQGLREGVGRAYLSPPLSGWGALEVFLPPPLPPLPPPPPRSPAAPAAAALAAAPSAAPMSPELAMPCCCWLPGALSCCDNADRACMADAMISVLGPCCLAGEVCWPCGAWGAGGPMLPLGCAASVAAAGLAKSAERVSGVRSEVLSPAALLLRACAGSGLLLGVTTAE